LWAAPALASNIPPLGGHITDPARRLGGEYDALNERFGKVMDDTHVDTASWITGAPADQSLSLGNSAFKQWNIGRDWDSGILFVFPSAGRFSIVQDSTNPPLTSAEVNLLVAGDRPDDPLPKRLEQLSDAIREVLIPKRTGKPRPWGYARPYLGHRYLAVTIAVLLAAVGLTVRRRRHSPALPGPKTAPAGSPGLTEQP
jgi:hypothetical protein